MTHWISSGTWDLGDPEKHRLQAAMDATLGTTILDIGCRDGTFALTLAQTRPDTMVVGFDTDASAIAWANNKASQLGIENAVFYELDLFDPKINAILGEKCFDTVLIMETLEHVPPGRVEQANTIAESFVKPGGRMIVTVPANSHISDPDHKTVFYREFIAGPGKVWMKECPHLWIAWFVDLPK